MNDTAIRTMLNRFAQAWENRDIDSVMACFTPDCVYSPSVRAGGNADLSGTAAVRAGVLKMFEYDAGATTQTLNLRIDGNFACWQWIYTCPDGRVIHGCDFFTIEDGLIQKKDAYRKFSE